MQVGIEPSQVICRDRGRPQMSAKREQTPELLPKTLRVYGALRAGRPRSQQIA